MEIIGIILVILFVLGIIGRISEAVSGGASSSPSYTPDSTPIPPLAIRVRKSTSNIEGTEIPTFVVEMKGQMPGPIYGSAEVEFFFHLFDSEENDGMEPPVLSSLDFFQEEDTFAFQFRMEPQEMSGEQYFPSWVEIFKLPVDCLGFPRKGRRKIKLRFAAFLSDQTAERTQFQFTFLKQGGDVPYGFAETIFSHEVTELGYLDQNKNRSKVRALTIELAMHVAAVDGSMDKAEGEAVKDWVKKIVSLAPKGEGDEMRRELNVATEHSYEKASRGETSLSSICKSLSNVSTDHQKYDALKLCVSVMSADGQADKSELKELDRIVTALGLDPSQYRKMLDPHLAKVKTSTSRGVEGGKMALLGIRDEMSKDEKHKILIEATAKWNSRVTHKDPEIRRKAEEMLGLIADLRNDLFD